MPNKCESCRFYGTEIVAAGENQRRIRFCTNPNTVTDKVREMFPDRRGVPLDMARDICDREGDGIFVYYEPKTPATGAATQPDDWRKELNEHLRDPQALKATA